MIRCADELIARHKKGVRRMMPWMVGVIVIATIFPKAAPFVIIPMIIAGGVFVWLRLRDQNAFQCPDCGGSCKSEWKSGPLVLTCQRCGMVHETDCVMERAGPRRRW